MAKKGQRQQFGFICPLCKRQNYVIERNKQNTQDTLKMKKYCPTCRKHALHKEKKKLH